MSVRRCGGCVLVGLLAWTASARAGGSWAGKIVVLKGTKEVQIGFSDDNGKQVYLAKLSGISYRVLAEKEGFLKVAQNGVSGWFPKEDAVALTEAVAYFTGRLQTKPADAQAYGFRAEALMLKEDFAPALKDIAEAIRLQPKEATWWTNRAYLRTLTKDYDNALKDCDEALRLDAKAARAFMVRGHVYRIKKEADKALKEYGEALRLEPKHVNALYGRANTYWDQKNYASAAVDYNAILKLDATHEEAMNELAWLLATAPDDKVRDGKRAVELATLLTKLSAGKNPDHLDTLAAAHAETDNFDEALRREKQALAIVPLLPETREAFEKRLKLYEQKKKFREE